MAASDLRYGRRGGGWAAPTGRSMASIRAQVANDGGRWPSFADEADPFHPVTIATRRTRAAFMAAEFPGSSWKALSDGQQHLVNTVPPSPAELADAWAGRARMAHARLACRDVDGHNAGRCTCPATATAPALDAIDLEAIRRHPDPTYVKPNPPAIPGSIGRLPPCPSSPRSSSPPSPSPTAPATKSPATAAPASPSETPPPAPPSPSTGPAAATSTPNDLPEVSPPTSAPPSPPSPGPVSPPAPPPSSAPTGPAARSQDGRHAPTPDEVAGYIHAQTAGHLGGGKRITATGCDLTIESRARDPFPANVTAWGSLVTCPTCLDRQHPPSAPRSNAA